MEWPTYYDSEKCSKRADRPGVWISGTPTGMAYILGVESRWRIASMAWTEKQEDPENPGHNKLTSVSLNINTQEELKEAEAKAIAHSIDGTYSVSFEVSQILKNVLRIRREKTREEARMRYKKRVTLDQIHVNMGWSERDATADDVTANWVLTEGLRAYFHKRDAPKGQRARPIWDPVAERMKNQIGVILEPARVVTGVLDKGLNKLLKHWGY